MKPTRALVLILRAAVAAALLVAGAGRARGQTFYTPRTVLARFFPSSQRVTYRRFALTPEVRGKLAQKLGAALPRDGYVFYYALTGQTVDGYALIDEQLGQYMPITYAVKFSPKGAVQQLEIMVYRENYGSEVTDARFRKQFVGKTASDPIVAGKDIDVISGASYSSKSVALGVKRDTLIIATALKNGAL